MNSEREKKFVRGDVNPRREAVPERARKPLAPRGRRQGRKRTGFLGQTKRAKSKIAKRGGEEN